MAIKTNTTRTIDKASSALAARCEATLKNMDKLAAQAGCSGCTMEKVTLPPWRRRLTAAEIAERYPWAAVGKPASRSRNVLTSLELDQAVMERKSLALQERYARIEAAETRSEAYLTDDAEMLLVAFGSAARICRKTVDLARQRGVRLGLLRPVTLWPFPTQAIARLVGQVTSVLVVELNAGQMVEDVRLAISCRRPVDTCTRTGGVIPSPAEVRAKIMEAAQEGGAE